MNVLHLKKLLVRIVSYSLILFLTACGMFLKPQLEPELVLLPPIDGPLSSVLKQVITIKMKEKETSFIVVSRFNHKQLKLVVLQVTGQVLLSLEYDGVEIKKTKFTALSLPSKEILAIMQFSLWPSSSIKKYYTPENGWFLIMNSDRRTLSTHSGPLLTVIYHKQTILIEHHLHHYQLSVHTLK